MHSGAIVGVTVGVVGVGEATPTHWAGDRSGPQAHRDAAYPMSPVRRLVANASASENLTGT